MTRRAFSLRISWPSLIGRRRVFACWFERYHERQRQRDMVKARRSPMVEWRLKPRGA